LQRNAYYNVFALLTLMPASTPFLRRAATKPLPGPSHIVAIFPCINYKYRRCENWPEQPTAGGYGEGGGGENPSRQMGYFIDRMEKRKGWFAPYQWKLINMEVPMSPTVGEIKRTFIL
jgi:hypothetical protein